MKSFSLIGYIGFGSVAGIGFAIAIYRILTMPRMENTFMVIAIAIAVAVCLSVAAGISYLAIRINHRRQLSRIDIDAKQIALDALRTRQYVTSERFDINHADHILAVLHGHVIESRQPKAIDKPRPNLTMSDTYTDMSEISDTDYQ